MFYLNFIATRLQEDVIEIRVIRWAAHGADVGRVLLLPHAVGIVGEPKDLRFAYRNIYIAV